MGEIMGIMAKVFIGINIFYAIYGTYFLSRQRTISGTSGLATPGGWIPVWQGTGVGLVLWFGLSPWHLIWWWPVGLFGGAVIIWKILCVFGLIPKDNFFNK